MRFLGAIMVGAFFFVIPICAQSTISKSNCNDIVLRYEKLSSGGESPVDGLSEKEVFDIIDCYLLEKGNHTPDWNVVLRNDLSQTFGPSPREVVALFEISKLFFQSDSFASAKVLFNLKSGAENSKTTVKKAFKHYRRWLISVKKIGLSEARRRKLDPLAGTGVKWY